MSYQFDLDEYTDEALETELYRRKKVRDSGLCDYCLRPFSEPPCRFPDRHAISDLIRFHNPADKEPTK